MHGIADKGLTHQQCFSMDYYTLTHQCWPTSKNLDLPVLCRHWVSFKGLAQSDEQSGRRVRRREPRESILSTSMDNDEVSRRL